MLFMLLECENDYDDNPSETKHGFENNGCYGTREM